MQGNQPIAILGTLLIVYIVLGVLYESYLHPLTILSTLPSAGVGALLALLLLKTEFSLVALLGLFLLIGVVMKNAILMIDVALQRERESGVTPEEAIREACLLRLRPILMTTMSALLGALPLMLGTGEGAELRRPLGIAIVGGLVVSQVLTLYTTPVVYLYLDRLRQWSERRKQRRLARQAPTTRIITPRRSRVRNARSSFTRLRPGAIERMSMASGSGPCGRRNPSGTLHATG